MQTEITAPETLAEYRALENELAEAEKAHASLARHAENGRLYHDGPGILAAAKVRLDQLREAYDSATTRLQAQIKANAESLLTDLDAAAASIGGFIDGAEPVHKIVARLKVEGHPLAGEVATAAHGVNILTNAVATLRTLADQLRAARG